MRHEKRDHGNMRLSRFVLKHRTIKRRREINGKDPETNITKIFGAVE